MQKSKLLYTLQLLSREELHALDDFLRSPHFVSTINQRVRTSLFQYIIRYYGDWEHPDLSKEKVFSKIFPGKKIVPGKIDKLMSALFKDVQKFIHVYFNESEEERFKELISLIRFFRHHSAHKYAEHYLEKAKKKLSTFSLRGTAYYYNDFLLSEELVQQYLTQFNSKSSLEHSIVFKPLDIFYLLKKLEQACFLLTLHRHRKPLEMPEMLDFLDTLKPFYARQGLLEIPLIKVKCFENFIWFATKYNHQAT